ncbi:P-loop NTPase fold protein [Candidatus Venteria ishoeyi]|uniref:P-loop NTPase fold protein n=1 Tax=Candidatus Venteria ishoeyi TaxID=1899563 RepID=UPI0011B0BFB6
MDLLGRTDFAKAIRQLLLGADTPFAMFINGRWGSGKTSMLRALMTAMGGIPV